jgi:hypothetical protein
MAISLAKENGGSYFLTAKPELTNFSFDSSPGYAF